MLAKLPTKNALMKRDGGEKKIEDVREELIDLD
jgi:hypothetical protein